MAQLGFRKVDEMIGRVDMLEARKDVEHWKAKHIDLSFLLHNPPAPSRFWPPQSNFTGARIE